MTLAQFSQFYLSTGWIVMCCIGFAVGWYAAMRRRVGLIVVHLAVAVAAAVIAVYGA